MEEEFKEFTQINNSPSPIFNEDDEIFTAYELHKQREKERMISSGNLKVKDKSLTQILPFLFLSSVLPATNKELLKENGITHILIVGLGMNFLFPQDFVYKRIMLADVPSVDIRKEFKGANFYIEQVHKNNGKLLIHCFAGRSRSASICIGYLIYKGMTFLDAHDYIKARRPSIKPNIGFIIQLREYEEAEAENNPRLSPEEFGY